MLNYQELSDEHGKNNQLLPVVFPVYVVLENHIPEVGAAISRSLGLC